VQAGRQGTLSTVTCCAHKDNLCAEEECWAHTCTASTHCIVKLSKHKAPGYVAGAKLHCGLVVLLELCNAKQHAHERAGAKGAERGLTKADNLAVAHTSP
jgi:hypothetical protein